MTIRYSDASGLCHPNLEELIEADHAIPNSVFRLFNDDPTTWSMDDTLCKLATVRPDLGLSLCGRAQRAQALSAKGGGKNRGN